MKPILYRIKQAPEVNLWLDGWNGGNSWEWTDNRKTAWHMRGPEAGKRLLRVRKDHPQATVEN